MRVKPKNKGKRKSPPTSASSPENNKILQGLLSILALIFLFATSMSRILLSDMPMNRDEGTYGYLGSLAAKGMTPYLDFYEMKPPMLFYLYGLGGSIFGFTDLGLRLFALVLTICSSLLVFFILRYHVSRHYAWIAAALFSILSLNPFASGFLMVAEHLVNTLVLTSFYLLHKTYSKKGFMLTILAGVAFSAAILTKQTAIFISPVFLLYFILERQRKPWFLQCIRFAGGVLLPVILLSILLAINGALEEALYWLTTYPANYATVVTPEEGKIYLNYFSTNIILFQVLLFGSFILVFLANVIWLKKKPFAWMGAFFLMASMTIIPGFRFYGQYWLLVFAPMALMTGAALNQLELYRPKIGLAVGYGVLMLVAGEIFLHTDYYFSKDTPDEVAKLYLNNPFGPIRDLARYAGTEMKENETFMVLGSEPQAYLYAGKEAPTRHVYMSMISKHDEKSKAFITEALSDLEHKQPTYVLFNFFPYSWGLTEKSNNQLYASSYSYVINHYVPVAAYHMNSNTFLYESQGHQITPSIANQVILFKRK